MLHRRPAVPASSLLVRPLERQAFAPEHRVQVVVGRASRGRQLAAAAAAAAADAGGSAMQERPKRPLKSWHKAYAFAARRRG